jgi:HlyD family secretion protein
MAKPDTLEKPFARGILRLWGTALLIIAGFLGGGVYWAFNAAVGGAVIASGRVTVETSVKQIQHSEGGYVDEILVKEGSHVDAGQILIRLDRTSAVAELAVVVDQLNAAIATEARLIAETGDMQDYVIAEEDMVFVASGEKFDRVMQSQRRLLETRQASMTGRIGQLAEQVSQTEEQIAGLGAQLAANDTELALVASELSDQESLLDRGLVVGSRANVLRRNMAQIEGQRGTLASEIARARLSISELQLQALQLRDDARRDALEEMARVQQEKARLIQMKITAEDRLKRLDVRTVQAGVVHDMQVFTVDGVIGPGQVLMTIIPQQDDLVVETRLATADIDQVYEGQPATLMFTSFNMRTTPQIEGSVVRVSPDVSIDDATGDTYYRARISISPQEAARLGENEIVPGMPVDAFIRTNERTVVSYLIQPITDHMNRAFREQ